MKIHIYYGGRGLVDDPTGFVLDKMQAVLEELNVSVERFNLYEIKNAITTLPQTLKAADGIILATTVEWYGIGGYMQSFLDAIWLYGDKQKISQLYMCPIVMSTTYGEREGKLNLSTAWEILGGIPCSGMCGYIKDTSILENNPDYLTLIEKKAENLYRTIHQKMKSLPASNREVNQTVAINKGMDLTPQESEQLSKYASNEEYVQKQKEDIQELASYFKGMLNTASKDETEDYSKLFSTHFHPQPGCHGTYVIRLDGKTEIIQIQIHQNEILISQEETKKPDIDITMTQSILQEIVHGHKTFQKAFMTGDIKMKGDFTLFRLLDELFVF
jgi:putative sterol carrier protein